MTKNPLRFRITHPTENIENIAASFHRFVTNATDRIPYHIAKNQAKANELQDQAKRKKLRNWMLLNANGVQLQRNQHQIHKEEDQIHFENVLLIEGEMKRHRI